ncbi:MAG TPA: SpoIVB peptidase S55 domain-containing protein [Polyangiaceae bacterium]|nr:SpoIVB peptidase S55 domain-containing protein [Polyangiaceae bacterium]
MRASLLAPLSVLLGLLVALPALSPSARADGRASRPDVISVSEIRKGMTGYGLTVFEGTKPEKFDVEVIDVLENFRPRQELVLVKTKHPRLEVAKIVAGMSGSPIYLNGKMIGAYAYGWSFGVEPVAGVTPIRVMLDDLERPLPKTLHGLPLASLPPRSRATETGRFEGADYDVRAHAQARASQMARIDQPGAVPLATPLLLGGVTPGVLQVARQLLEPLGLEPQQGGGGSSKKAPAASERHYVDGGAIGVDLVRGDLSAMGLGTVTRVEGKRLVAFGHPMMGVGVTSLPTSEARVLWFMASAQRSFKMGEGLGPLGALVNDRQSSIVVDEAVEPPTVPVSLHIEGEPGAPFKDWNFQVAHDEFLTPAFLAMAIGAGLETTAAERRDVTWHMESKLTIAGRPPVTIQDYGSAPTGSPQTGEVMQSSLVKGVGAVFNNPWEPARIERVDVRVSLTFGREIASLRGVDLLTPVIDAGGAARLRVTLEPFAGPAQTRVIEVPIPRNLAGGRVRLQLRPGYTISLPRPAPESLDDLVGNLSEPTLALRSLVVSFESGEGGASHRGSVAEKLPPAALDRLTTASSSIAPAQYRVEQHHVTTLPFYLVGSDSVDVEVRPALR